jgi:hypothetical protein
LTINDNQDIDITIPRSRSLYGQSSPYFFSSSDRINSKLGVKVPYGLLLSSLLINFDGQSALTFMVLTVGRKLLAQWSNFEIERTISCSTSYEKP